MRWKLTKQIRWKAFFSMDRSEDTQETYGLKSINRPLKIKKMEQFEKDLSSLVSKLKF